MCGISQTFVYSQRHWLFAFHYAIIYHLPSLTSGKVTFSFFSLSRTTSLSLMYCIFAEQHWCSMHQVYILRFDLGEDLRTDCFSQFNCLQGLIDRFINYVISDYAQDYITLHTVYLCIMVRFRLYNEARLVSDFCG